LLSKIEYLVTNKVPLYGVHLIDSLVNSAATSGRILKGYTYAALHMQPARGARVQIDQAAL